MSISFNKIPGPGQLRTPGVYAEFDGSLARQGLPILSYNVLIMGQILATGTATAEDVVRVTSVKKAQTLFGRGSMLARMIEAYLNVDQFTPLYCLPLDDNADGAKASRPVTIAGPATEAGTLNFYVSGLRVQVGVSDTESADSIATDLAAAINADLDLEATATANAAVVTVTAKHKGEVGNAIDLRHSYLDGESLPAGISVTIGELAPGTGNPDLSTIKSGTGLAALPDTWWQVMISPYTDSANLNEIHKELADRYDPTRELWAEHVTAMRGTFNELVAKGDQYPQLFYSSICAAYDTISGIDVQAAQLGAMTAYHLAMSPARPLGGIGTPLVLPDVMPVPMNERLNFGERNQLLFAGIATVKVNNSDQVVIERLLTSYQENSTGAADDAFLRVETLATLWYLAWSWKNRITTKYPRHSLADLGFEVQPGQAVVTPDVLNGEWEGQLLQWAKAALVENIDAGIANTVFQRSESDVDRVDSELGPDLVNQFLVLAGKFSFRL